MCWLKSFPGAGWGGVASTFEREQDAKLLATPAELNDHQGETLSKQKPLIGVISKTVPCYVMCLQYIYALYTNYLFQSCEDCDNN